MDNYGNGYQPSGQDQGLGANQGQPAPPASNPYHAGYSYAAQQQPAVGQSADRASAPVGEVPQRPASEPDRNAQHSKKGSGGGKTFLFGFLGALLACVLAFGGFSAYNMISGSQASVPGDPQVTESLGATTSTPIVVDGENSSLAEAVAAKCLPSVAAIDVYASSASVYGYSSGFGYGHDFGYGDNAQSDSLVEYSLGSGVVLSSDGYVITNAHVIDGGSAFKVTIEGETYDAELVGTDSSSDVAVLKAVDASNLTAMEIGDSDDLTIGEWVMSIGSPFGLEQSVATGIVSATSRSQIMSSSSGVGGETTIYPNMIQTDAAINPGNSGGALVDSQGRLIGINTLITSYSGNYSGVGFAIPVNYAINLAQQIIDGQTPTHAQLGVSLNTVTSDIALRYGLPVESGAYIAAVSSGSGAEAAGLQVGDIVVAFDGDDVTSASDLMLDVRSHMPGDQIMLTVVSSNGQERTVEVTLGSDGVEASNTSQR